jgi:hypothetical protein
MESRTSVVSLLGKEDKAVNRVGRSIGEQLDDDVALLGDELDARQIVGFGLGGADLLLLLPEHDVVLKRRLDRFELRLGRGLRLQADLGMLTGLLRAESVTIDPELDVAGKAMPSAISELGTIYMPLEGVIDVAAEKERLNGQLADIEQNFKRVQSKLENESFVNKAPAHVVERQVTLKQDLITKRQKLQGLLEMLDEA